MGEAKRQQRPRRSFTDEFKASTVPLVLDEGKSVSQVARDLDLTASALQRWVDQARADRTRGKTGLTSEEREELARLRKENRELRMEWEILKKPRPSSRKSSTEIRLHRRGEGPLPNPDSLPCTQGLARRVLRLARTTALGASA